jgi:sulfonate transport system ATP-binding protein
MASSTRTNTEASTRTGASTRARTGASAGASVPAGDGALAAAAIAGVTEDLIAGVADGYGNRAVIVNDLRRSFDGRAVLDGVDLTIDSGEFVALLGRSGSGKSTILRALGGLDPDFEGQALVPRKLAVVFQEARLLPWQRVITNVTLGLSNVIDVDTSAINALGRQALDEVGLAPQADAWPMTLSGGEAQRVALARALVREPQLVLLDEPFGALDALTRVKMHALLQELCRKHRPAVLLVTHDVDEAIVLADRVMVLTDGKISLNLPVDLPSPRLRSNAQFADLRTRLLGELGLDESLEGNHRAVTS